MKTSAGRLLLLLEIFAAGVLAGSIGIGGGLIINPKLLGWGYGPEVSVAVSCIVVVFSSVMSTSQLFVEGAYDVMNSLEVFFVSLVGSFFGKFVIDRYLERTGKQSILVWILFAMTLVSPAAAPL